MAQSRKKAAPKMQRPALTVPGITPKPTAALPADISTPARPSSTSFVAAKR